MWYSMNDLLLPAFPDNPVVIASSSSKEYAPYLAVFLESIKDHMSNEKKYDFIIFESSWSDYLRDKFKKLYSSANFSIRFINPEPYLGGRNLNISDSRFRRECYYRLWAPIILRNYKKILFTDIDLLAQGDISLLLENDFLSDMTIAACIDSSFEKAYQRGMSAGNINIREYVDSVLKIKPDKYYNTGVLLIDVEKYIKADVLSKILDLISNNFFLYQEQCALNSFFAEKIATLPPEWNCQINNGTIFDKELNETYLNKIKTPKLYHYLGENKVWYLPERELSDIWWQYARRTPFYEAILANLMNYKNSKLRDEQIKLRSEQAKLSNDQAKLRDEQVKLKAEQAKLRSEQAKLSNDQAKLKSELREKEERKLFNRIKRKIYKTSLVFFPLNTRRRNVLKTILRRSQNDNKKN